jgi:hypothetical protein
VEGASSNRKQQSAKQYRRQFVQVPPARWRARKIRLRNGPLAMLFLQRRDGIFPLCTAGAWNSTPAARRQRPAFTPWGRPWRRKGKQLPGVQITPDFVVGNGQYD